MMVGKNKSLLLLLQFVISLLSESLAFDVSLAIFLHEKLGLYCWGGGGGGGREKGSGRGGNSFKF